MIAEEPTTTNSLIALVSAAVGAIVTILGKVGWDRVRSDGHAPQTAAQILSEREQIVFQTTMRLAIEGISEAISKSSDQALERIALTTLAMQEAAGAIREVHEDIKTYKAASTPAIQAVEETHKMVKEMHGTLLPHAVGRYAPPPPTEPKPK